MGGLLSEKFLDTNLSIPFAAPPLNTPSLQKYKRVRDKNYIEYWLYFCPRKNNISCLLVMWGVDMLFVT